MRELRCGGGGAMVTRREWAMAAYKSVYLTT